MTVIESTPSNVFQRLGKSKESKGNTMTKSQLFNSPDIITHNDGREMSIITECFLLDGYDAIIDNETSLGTSVLSRPRCQQDSIGAKV